MRICITGSVATDHLMTFPGKFTDSLLADQLHTISLSFLVDDLQVRRGGVAANIAFGLGSLGADPVLLAGLVVESQIGTGESPYGRDCSRPYPLLPGHIGYLAYYLRTMVKPG